MFHRDEVRGIINALQSGFSVEVVTTSLYLLRAIKHGINVSEEYPCAFRYCRECVDALRHEVQKR